jgi:Zn-dependent protease
MNPETIIQLRQQLEAIREFQRKNASWRFSYVGYWGQFFMGILFLGRLIISQTPDANVVAQVVYYLFGIGFTFQGFYLIIKFKMDKRVKLIIEAMLSIGESKPS